MQERIEADGALLALIIRAQPRSHGVHFFTSSELSQQVANICHPRGHLIPPHVHNPVAREVHLTQEVLVIRAGKLRVDFYSTERQYLESRILGAGDIIVLIQGGHGFEVLEELDMVEVKQGPYAGDQDKTRFEGVTTAGVRVRE
ncbi:MAG: hypothetical protein AB2A00_00035 [Myxococcota bacterium]